MVLQKRLYYGFNGFEVPAMPRASRSVRRRCLFEKKVEDSRMRAFDLLATVAGKLLEEKGSSAAPSNVSAQISESAIRKDSIKQEQQDGPHSFKPEPCDQGSCDESASVFVLSSQRHGHDFSFKEYLHSKDDSTFGLASVKTKSERPANTTCARDFGESRKEYENFPCMICGKHHVERGSPGCAESHDGKVNDEIDRQMEVEQPRTGSVIDGTVVDMFHLKDPMEIDTKPPALVSSDSSVEVPLHGINDHCSSFTRCQDDVKVVSRDDDENSSVSTRLSTLKSYRLSRLGDRRIRKLLASKHWKSAPSMLKDGVFSNTESDIKPIFRSRKICYTHQRSQRCSFKRRKLFGRSLISISDREINGEAVSSSPEKKVISEATGLGGTMHQASRAPETSQKSSLESRDSHVKLRIKSFRVPELFIQIPETATVGSLKAAVHWWSMYKNFPAWVKRPYWYCTTWMRGFGHCCLLEATNPKGGQRLPTIRSLTRTVMEAVTAVLGSGLRVGVLLHGKKVRDDNRTLLQTGISHDDKLDSLGFTLEPTTVHPPPPQCSEDCHSLLPCDSTEPLTRYPPVPALEPGLPETSPDLPLADSGNSTEDSYESVPFPPDMSTEKTTPDSKALVAVPAMSVEALAVVPLHGKSRRSELVQRRIRRPFSVSEVEALVQAVEKLGTGRWRDVKLCAFENAKHRTYVDLKDKWKTLVHTARISPQQRRGEPVPQELLDRVLSAHAYWSQQNSKTGGRTNNNSNQPDSPLPAQRFD